jgi:hypothetical protein
MDKPQVITNQDQWFACMVEALENLTEEVKKLNQPTVNNVTIKNPDFKETNIERIMSEVSAAKNVLPNVEAAGGQPILNKQDTDPNPVQNGTHNPTTPPAPPNLEWLREDGSEVKPKPKRGGFSWPKRTN